MREQETTGGQRLDKWLWVARFYKTRSLAQAAIEGGKVRLNGQQPKPARELRPGDQLELSLPDGLWALQVLGLHPHRRPAAEARMLYAESAASQARRQAEAELRVLAPTPGSDRAGRPTKRDRRRLGALGGD